MSRQSAVSLCQHVCPTRPAQHLQGLYEHISSLEKDIGGLKKEIRERDETIGDKEKRIYDLKKKNQARHSQFTSSSFATH